MHLRPEGPAGRQRFWAATMWFLTVLFSMRVLGQAVQRWLPQAWLPPFAAWQGSGTPYPLLLAMQFVILGAMACAAYGAWKGTMRSTRGRMLWTAWLGRIYMFAAIGRIAVGLGVPGAPAWFTAEISSAFHIVLAGFVLALARYHSVSLATREGGLQ
jgi:hypothetical protein